LDDLAAVSRHTYRRFVWENPAFPEFFRAFTPVDELALLEIASRPARRPDDADYLSSLRAIPWVFSWTQNRVLLPAWFGAGSAFAAVDNATLRALYERLPFFRAVVDNLEMTLAKSSLSTARATRRRSCRCCARSPASRRRCATPADWAPRPKQQLVITHHPTRRWGGAGMRRRPCTSVLVVVRGTHRDDGAHPGMDHALEH